MLGTVPLEQLTRTHVARMITDLEAAGRGAVTIRPIHATLRSALTDAVKRRRLAHNPAVHAVPPDVVRTERGGWGVAEGVAFLAHVADRADRDTELWNCLIGTGLRKGEAIALHWSDVDLTRRIAQVRQTPSGVDNSRLIFTASKTRGSAAGVGLSKRVIAALQRQRERQDAGAGTVGRCLPGRRPDLLPGERGAAAAGVRAAPLPAAHRGGRSPPRARARSQASGRVHDDRRRGAAGDREQDAPALHGVDHRRRVLAHDGRRRP